MDSQNKAAVGVECIVIARQLGDFQNTGAVISPKMCTRLVNALLNAGNTLEHEAKELGALPGRALPPTPNGVLRPPANMSFSAVPAAPPLPVCPPPPDEPNPLDVHPSQR